MNLPDDTPFYVLISLLLAVLVMLVLYRPHLRTFLSRTPRPTASTITHSSTVETKAPSRELSIKQLVSNHPSWTNTEKVVPSGLSPKPTSTPAKKTHQPFDAFLVLDFEGTCTEGSSFDYPNELIEFPVILLRWTDKDPSGEASKLVIIDQFHSFIRPEWKPQLTKFCTELTGITQAQVDQAPDFLSVLLLVRAFLVKHNLIDATTGNAISRFCWCTDGPWDLGDLLTKQCFHSKIKPPNWLQNNVIDVRRMVKLWMAKKAGQRTTGRGIGPKLQHQLKALDLDFEGRPHSGLDDTRNIAKIVAELARRGVQLQPNYNVTPRKRFGWMGKAGHVHEDRILTGPRR